MSVRELSASPNMAAMFARAGAALIPGASRLPFVSGGAREIPDLTLALDDVAIDPDRLARYDRVCGFSLSDSVPATYPHILAFPLHLALMTNGSFPLPPIGLVHIANRITHHRRLRIGERLALRVWATGIEPHPRGRQFSIRTEARVADELVWEEASTNLRRGQGGGGGDAGPRGQHHRETGSLEPVATWALPGDLGRRYGSVSGDLNPIHLHPLGARPFGFRSAIAHGMWTKARCLAALAPGLPERFTLEVEFRKPILLPSTVEFLEAPRDGGIRFAVREAARGTPHLDGDWA
ncbi:MAG: hypothetical protein JOZ98_03615 [Solirubrobacterales bacterium]|nr:hypothetical protein [Solirubrobacterales bacterium]MBV9799702.1 hypothetical protein [Solirubrobacterales bacterium]